MTMCVHNTYVFSRSLEPNIEAASLLGPKDSEVEASCSSTLASSSIYTVETSSVLALRAQQAKAVVKFLNACMLCMRHLGFVNCLT